MSRRVVLVSVVLTAVVAATALAVPFATGSTSAKYTVVAVDFRFRGMPARVVRGTHTFALVNRGQAMHDLKIAGKKTSILRRGERAVLKVTFRKKGRFAFLCTVPGHAALGMKGTVVVR